MTDTEKLRDLIKGSGLKLSFIASKMGITPYSLTKKITNVTEFRTCEISSLCEILGIDSLQEKENIFFYNKS